MTHLFTQEMIHCNEDGDDYDFILMNEYLENIFFLNILYNIVQNNARKIKYLI